MSGKWLYLGLRGRRSQTRIVELRTYSLDNWKSSGPIDQFHILLLLSLFLLVLLASGLDSFLLESGLIMQVNIINMSMHS